MADDADALPVTVLLAVEPGQPVVVLDGNAALRMAIVDRQSIGALDEGWDRPGVYLLLDPVALDGAYGAYVGKAPAGLRDRLRTHLRQKDHWSRAVLVIRDTTYGWDSAQVGWLEGRLYDLLDGATLATLANKQRPQDETVRPYDRAALEAATEPIAAILRLLGCSPDTFADETGAGRERAYISRDVALLPTHLHQASVRRDPARSRRVGGSAGRGAPLLDTAVSASDRDRQRRRHADPRRDHPHLPVRRWLGRAGRQGHQRLDLLGRRAGGIGRPAGYHPCPLPAAHGCPGLLRGLKDGPLRPRAVPAGDVAPHLHTGVWTGGNHDHRAHPHPR